MIHIYFFFNVTRSYYGVLVDLPTIPTIPLGSVYVEVPKYAQRRRLRVQSNYRCIGKRVKRFGELGPYSGTCSAT